jgi:hypothetical protein
MQSGRQIQLIEKYGDCVNSGAAKRCHRQKNAAGYGIFI